jgi:hypothetical protein
MPSDRGSRSDGSCGVEDGVVVEAASNPMQTLMTPLLQLGLMLAMDGERQSR